MEFVIEKGTPIPVGTRGRILADNAIKFKNIPLNKMEVNDSLLVEYSYLKRNSLAAFLSIYNKENTNTHFVTRREQLGTRIFRTK